MTMICERRVFIPLARPPLTSVSPFFAALTLDDLVLVDDDVLIGAPFGGGVG